MNDQDKPEPDERHHSDVPAEGKRWATPTDSGVHAQAPAEGPDSEETLEEAADNDGNNDGSGDSGDDGDKDNDRN